MQGGDYEVFLSFRGPDTRAGFTDFLYTCLAEAGVRTFKDDEDIGIGEEFPPKLIQAIEQSKISIPILSKDYASSVWCLNELTQMVECVRGKGQRIMPIFYDVKPSEVKYQTGCYAEAFLSHQKKGRYTDETIRKWRAALHEVGCLLGFVLPTNSHRREGEFAKEVAAYVLTVLKRNFVGIEPHVEKVMELLSVESSDVHLVGIHGIGGTGKTTIAMSVYKRIFRLFDGCSFLESVRENVKIPGGLINLQVQLISDFLGAMDRQIPSVDDGIKSIRSRFFHKKILIVIDDVEPGFRLQPFLGILDWLGPGSRIIITARNEQALDELNVSRKHKVGEMQKDDALVLFLVSAFREKRAPDHLVSLSTNIVSTIDRLPLTVEVVGSYLFSKELDVWEQTLFELKRVSPQGVRKQLMVVIDALPSKQRQIFLDIACFFIGEDESVARYLWSDCDSTSGLDLEVPIPSSIVKIENNKLRMHDQLRDLGRDIVQLEDCEPGKRTRLWNLEEALDVLLKGKASESVEGVLLKFDSGSQYTFRPAYFVHMSKLRFLQLDQAKLQGKFEQGLSSLRWLHWQGCPRNLCAENLDLKELVILDLSWSKINENWNGWSEIEKAKNLRVLNLTGCYDMIRTPDLSHYKCLERLILERCIRLVEIGSSIKSLERLVSLNLRSCTELNKLPEELGSLISLGEILIDETAVQEIPASISCLQKLRKFSACNCLSLIQLPESFSHVRSLEVLVLNGTEITKFPLFGELGVLHHLSINRCWSILKLPKFLRSLASLVELDLSSTAIDELPDTVNELCLLRVLKIDCTFVRVLPSTIWTLTMLQELHASRCRSMDGEISEDIKKLSALRVLRLGYSRILGLPDTISELTNLQKLDLLHCHELHKVPKLPSTLISLSVSSKLIDTISDISSLNKLEELFLADGSQELVLLEQRQIEAKGCTFLELGGLSELKILQLSLLKIQLLPAGFDKFRNLTKLTKLSLGCIHLEKPPLLPPSLFTLSLRHYKLRTKLDVSYLKLLSEFELFDCAVAEVTGLGKFESLRVFRISHCNLQQLDELENLIFLASLNVSYCQSLERLPNLSKLKKLKDIRIKGCPKIPDVRRVEHLKSIEKPSSSEVECSKPANTEHSSIQGVERKYKEKDDGKAFPSDDEDEDEDNITERKNNKTAKCIALEVSHEPTLPPEAQTHPSKSRESITETVGVSSNLQSSPSAGGSSTTWARVNVKLLTSSVRFRFRFRFRLTLSMLILSFFLAIASKFNRQLIFRTKPTHSFPHKSDLFDVKPDKDSSLPVDLTGTETTGISPTTEQGDMPFDRASTIPSLATIVPALPPPAARPKPSSATDEDRTPIDAESDLYGDDEETLFLKIESLLSGDSGKQNTGAGMSRSSQSDLQAYQKASQEVENIMSQGLLAIMFNPKLLGHLQEFLNFLVEHKTPEVSTFGHVYLKLQHFIKSAGDSLSSQRKILIECERFEREFKKEKNVLEYDKDEVLLLKQQIEETAKGVADNEQFIAKLQAEIEARKLRLENAKSELSSLLTKRSEKVKELKNKSKRVLSMKSENPSMEKKRNQAEKTIGKINVEWNELHADIKGRLASK